jgi:hypothetical protein
VLRFRKSNLDVRLRYRVERPVSGREFHPLKSSAFTGHCFANKEVEHLDSKSILIVKAYIDK